MKRSAKLAAALAALAIGCAGRVATPTPPRDLRVVTVPPANNRTGERLLVAGGSLLESLLSPETSVTVPDLLAEEVAATLRARGYQATGPAELDAALRDRAPANPADAARLGADAARSGFVLYLEIRRWEADAATHPAFIIVGLSASAIEVSSGREVWSARLPVHPIPTPGAATLGAATRSRSARPSGSSSRRGLEAAGGSRRPLESGIFCLQSKGLDV